MNVIEPLQIPKRSTITSSIPSFAEFPVPMAGTGVVTTSVQRLASDALVNGDQRRVLESSQGKSTYAINLDLPLSDEVARIANQIRRIIDTGAHQLLNMAYLDILNTGQIIYAHIIQSQGNQSALGELRSRNFGNAVALLNNIAEYFAIIGKTDEARNYYSRALECALLLGARQFYFDAYYELQVLGPSSAESVKGLISFAKDAYDSFYAIEGGSKIVDGQHILRTDADYIEMRSRGIRNIRQAELLATLHYWRHVGSDTCTEDLTEHIADFERQKMQYVQSYLNPNEMMTTKIAGDQTRTTPISRTYNLRDAQVFCQIEQLIAGRLSQLSLDTSTAPILAKYIQGGFWLPQGAGESEVLDKSLVFMSFLSRVDLRFSLMQAYGNHLKYSTGANSAQDDRWAQYEILYRIARSIAGYPTDSTMRDTIEGFLERVKNDPTLTSFKAALMGTSPGQVLNDALQKNTAWVAQDAISGIMQGRRWNILLHGRTLLEDRPITSTGGEALTISLNQGLGLSIEVPSDISKDVCRALEDPAFSSWIQELLNKQIMKLQTHILDAQRQNIEHLQSSIAGLIGLFRSGKENIKNLQELIRKITLGLDASTTLRLLEEIPHLSTLRSMLDSLASFLGRTQKGGTKEQRK